MKLPLDMVSKHVHVLLLYFQRPDCMYTVDAYVTSQWNLSGVGKETKGKTYLQVSIQ